MLVYNIICRHLILDIRFRFDNNWLESTNHTLQIDNATERAKKSKEKKMPTASLWAILIALAMYAFGLTMKNAEIRHTLKRIRDELAAARSEIAPLDEKQQKQIQDIERKYQAQIDELSSTASGLRVELNHVTKDLSLSRKYLKKYAPAGFNIDNEEAYEKGWNNADLPASGGQTMVSKAPKGVFNTD